MQPVVQSIQSLSAIVSVTMLDLPRSIESLELQIMPEQGEEELGEPPLVSDTKAINEIHDIMFEAASSLSTLAGPAVLAWSLVLKNMRYVSQARREAREIRQSVYAIEGLTGDPSLENDDASSLQTEEKTPRRRLSVGSGSSAEVLPYDEVLERTRPISLEDDPIRNLALCALEGSRVFDLLVSLAMWYGAATGSALVELIPLRARLVILYLTRCSIEVLDYASEVVSTILAVLTGGQSFWKLFKDQISSPFFDVIGTFMNDEYLVQNIVGVAISRYPYESLPFLKIIHAVAACQTLDTDGSSVALRILQQMPSFTFALSDQFAEYETIQEEDNANTIQLTQFIVRFEPRDNMKVTNTPRGPNSSSMALTLVPDDFTIPAGTQGRIVMESNPKVAIWFHEYSGLKYLGKLLETGLMAADHVDAITGEMADRESIAEIIGLFATLLLASTEIDRRNEVVDVHCSARQILEEASEGLGRNRDIVTVVFKLFEEELQRQSAGSGQDSSTDILTASIRFIYALTPILPGRVWPLLGRGELLDADGGGGRLSAVLGCIELVTYKYDFLVSCVYLFRALVEDCVKLAVLRKRSSTALVRSETSDDLGTGVPEQVLSKILFSFTRTLLDVYETACTWKFEVEEQYLSLSELISTEFCNILYCAYGVDDSQGPQQKLTNSLISSADHIVDTLLSTTSGHLRFQPFLRVLLDGFSTPVSTLQPPLLVPWLSHVRAGLKFATNLIRLGTLLERPTSQLENRLFQASPLIARLYAVSEIYQSPVIQLFEALVLSAASVAGEPTSLLGYLGAQTSKNFIQMLLDLGKPLDDDAHATEIWHLSSVIISSRQQWFSIYLLTGRHPKQSLKDGSDHQAPAFTKTLLKIALQKLSDVQRLPDLKAVAILEFVSQAQNFWPWAMGDLQKQTNFIKSITEYAVTQRFPVNVDRQEQVIVGSYRMRMAAYIAEILAMYTYHSRQIGDAKHAEKLLQDIKNSFYLQSAVSSTSYNASLHSNLKRNFEARYKPCSLQNFKRTLLFPRQIGRLYFYDIQLADKMLNSDQAWVGRKNDGLSEDLALANINLSLVDTEIVRLLATTCQPNLTILGPSPWLQASCCRVDYELVRETSITVDCC
jgi:nuclear pore complex protein Nup188